MLSPQLTQEIGSAMQRIFGSELLSIVLYGSAARGEDTVESDVDLALFLRSPMTGRQFDQMAEWFAEAGLRHDMVFSPIDIEQTQFDRWVRVLPFYRNIQREGILLWKAA